MVGRLPFLTLVKVLLILCEGVVTIAHSFQDYVIVLRHHISQKMALKL
jgi:hypothetical protein